MSGSGGNAFLDFLRVIAPASVPVWVLTILAAIISVALALALIRINAFTCQRMEGKIAAQSPDRQVTTIALAATLGGLAAYPFAPHLFFADIELGLFLIISLFLVTAIGAEHAMGAQIPLAIALLVPVVIGGTLNLIEASRLQSDWYGMGWFVFKNPFGLPALVVCVLATLEVTRREQYAAKFLLSTVGEVFFFGGFESPLTWSLRRSLGEDPGFLNHVALADGSTQTRIAIGGLVFQLVCMLTLLAKTMLCNFVLIRMSSMRSSGRLERWMALGARPLTSVALLLLLGAGLWEWVRVALLSGGPGA